MVTLRWDDRNYPDPIGDGYPPQTYSREFKNAHDALQYAIFMGLDVFYIG